MTRLKNLALNPWIILLSLAGGLTLGAYLPAWSLKLAFVGHVYLDLMKMVVLPFMLSAVILSTQRLIQEGSGGRLFGRVLLVFAVFAFAAAVIGAGTMLTLRPGADLPPETLDTFGEIVGGDLNSNNLAMELNGTDPRPPATGLETLLLSLVPSNIFAALTKDETLKILVFSILLGIAVGQVPRDVSDGFSKTLETLYQGCQTIMQWMNYLLPLVLLTMSAGQLAKTGVEPLLAMTQFVAAFALASALLLLPAIWIIWQRGPLSLGATLAALRGPFALAIATRNSVICMPSMIYSLTRQLEFARAQVELLVPLSVSLLRIGPIVYYVCATLFIAQLYGLALDAGELALVITASILAGFASAGMTGLAIVSLTSITCGYLGLPFEAAFILFLAVDPICDILRTLVLVIGNTASVALIGARPARVTETACLS
ncbi:dicarboxylate/amino acid:cation symporter [Thiocystis violascens]|uniref:Na+/H+ dicarboxylate symporter n=1 Tax=Thiocystis violascens (strain ATCC 17096 / DSM 198 / 6111) TaxID=765911 RepID=I3YFZ9_THIV6|nr:cation:dicarboxylase symporter family transporter [Thiocystis violascens]AFL75917.1 Na+/H+ dicarboxylate symporter [Thiocystis violascens DSM 198]